MRSFAATAAVWVEELRVLVAARMLAIKGLLRRSLEDEARHLFLLTLVVGLVCGLVAVSFHLAIQAAEGLLIQRALHAPGDSWMFWTILSPTIGGLCAGAALTWLTPGARGSGIPQVKRAFAIEGGRVRFRDAVGKFIIASLQIGSGASLGREGPTVQICAGATSLLARATSLAPRNMRRLTPVGVAAGIAAAFNAPIAAVTFTIEEIVGTLDQAVLSGVVVAAALAAVIERGILGVHPVIEVAQNYGLDHASSLPLYLMLGLSAAVVSVAFTDSLLWLRAWFRGLRKLPSWMHPGVGGLVTGVLAVLVLHFLGTEGVNGGGYQTLGLALAGKLGLRALVVLCAVKLAATVFSYSSGGAGGIFAPSLFVGAMLGGALGHLDVAILRHEPSQLGAFALVGMGAVFAGVIRAPITSVLIIFEMTGGYGLVLPLMLANMTSYMIARRWRPVPIYEALLAQDGVVLPHAGAKPSDRLRSTAPLPAISASALWLEAPVVPRGTHLSELARALGRSGVGAVIVPEREGGSGGAAGELGPSSEVLVPKRAYGVVLPEHLAELSGDRELEQMLVAADLARSTVTLVGDPGIEALVASFKPDHIHGVVCVDAASGQIRGLVTRHAVSLVVVRALASGLENPGGDAAQPHPG